MTKQAPKKVGGLLAALLPFGIILIVLFVLWRKFAPQISDWFRTLGSGGLADDRKEAETAVAVDDAVKQKGLTVTAYHRSQADAIHTHLNEMKGVSTAIKALVNNTPSDETEKRIAEIFRQLPFSADVFCVMSAYGRRLLKNRQSVFLGFVWDDTMGSLKEHVSRYMDHKPSKDYILECIRRAEIGYGR